MYGCGVNGRGDVHEPERRFARLQRDFARVSDESDIGIVDREREVGLIRSGRFLTALYRERGVRPGRATAAGMHGADQRYCEDECAQNGNRRGPTNRDGRKTPFISSMKLGLVHKASWHVASRLR